MNNPAAFPNNYGDVGMTLRDYFVGQALIGACSNIESLRTFAKYDPNNDRFCNNMAEYCYAVADAMLAERERNK